MSKRVKQKIDELIMLRDMRDIEEEEKKKMVRVTVPFDKLSFLRLDYVVNELGLTKADFMREIAMAAILDIEEKLGLDHLEHVKSLWEKQKSVPDGKSVED